MGNGEWGMELDKHKYVQCRSISILAMVRTPERIWVTGQEHARRHDWFKGTGEREERESGGEREREGERERGTLTCISPAYPSTKLCKKHLKSTLVSLQNHSCTVASSRLWPLALKIRLTNSYTSMTSTVCWESV